MVPKGFLEGWIHFYAGNKERAYTALDSVRWILEMEAKENPGDQQAHLYVALTYAAMGWKDAALAEIARAKEKPDGLADGGAFRPCRRARRRIAPPRAASCYRARARLLRSASEPALGSTS